MRSGTATAPAGALVGGRVRDPTAVGIALKQLLARNDITETRALVAANDAVATFRVLRYPAAASDAEVDSAIARELPLDPSRMATRWVEVPQSHDLREVYVASWDRAEVKNIVDATKLAGLDPSVVELKSTCVARAVTEPSCVVLDLSAEPMDATLIDHCVPQVWHNFHADITQDDNVAAALAAPLRSVLRFYKSRRDTEYGPHCPVLITGEHVLPTHVVARLSELVDHPVQPLPMPARVPADIRHTTYLTCLGLVMRRTR